MTCRNDIFIVDQDRVSAKTFPKQAALRSGVFRIVDKTKIHIADANRIAVSQGSSSLNDAVVDMRAVPAVQIFNPKPSGFVIRRNGRVLSANCAHIQNDFALGMSPDR